MERIKELEQVVNGTQVSDGAGVKLTRLIGTPALNMLDPFLLFDVFSSDQAEDYLAGFPAHPHRGFETVSYMLSGKMKHKDSAGNEGVIEAGGVQWMTAGKGIIHSEMPEHDQGLMAGFQLWVNLPAENKMTSPRYQEHADNLIPRENHQDSYEVKVIAGETDHGTKGVVENAYVEPLYLHVTLSSEQSFQQSTKETDNSFIYVINGELAVGRLAKTLKSGQLGVLAAGEQVQVHSLKGSEFLLISAHPLNEPVARGGPFVMNHRDEIDQAFADYRQGNFA